MIGGGNRMSLQDFLSALDALVEEASSAFDAATDAESLEVARVRYFGQKKRCPARHPEADGGD